MKQQISSRSTRFWKTIFPVGMSVFMGGVTLLLFLTVPESGPAWIKYQFLATWLLTTFAVVALGSQLKEVSQDANRLYIHTGQGEVSVPLANIKQVKLNTWVHFGNKHPVVVHFATPTELGSKITFLPTGNAGVSWKSAAHPIVEKLQEAVKRAQ